MCSGGRRISCPRSVTRPLSGWSSPAASDRTVDLPHPLGPSSARNSPLSTRNVKSESTSVSPLSS